VKGCMCSEGLSVDFIPCRLISAERGVICPLRLGDGIYPGGLTRLENWMIFCCLRNKVFSMIIEMD